MDNIRVQIKPHTDEASQFLEYEVFRDAGYIEPNSDEVVKEFAAYPNSEFVVAQNDSELTGIMRLVYARANMENLGLPTLKAFDIWDQWRVKIEEINPEKLGEFGTLAVLKPFRGGKTTYLLKRKAIVHPILNGYRYGISMIDKGLLTRLNNGGYKLNQIGEEKKYMGSVTVPVMASLYQFPQSLGIWLKKSLIG